MEQHLVFFMIIMFAELSIKLLFYYFLLKLNKLFKVVNAEKKVI